MSEDYINYNYKMPVNKGKQEKLEEAAEYYAHNYFEMHETNNYKALKQGFEAGAKWQAERMYSEEEVLNILHEWSMYKVDIELGKLADELPNILPYDKWFEQFKKK